MTTKVEPTVEKWDGLVDKLVEGAGADWEVGNIDDKKSFNGWKAQLKKDILGLIAHSLQEAKAEERERILKLVGEYETWEPGVTKKREVFQIRGRNHIRKLLASLKQEEEK